MSDDVWRLEAELRAAGGRIAELKAENERLRKWGRFAVREFDVLRRAYNAIASKPPPELGSHVPSGCAVLVQWAALAGDKPERSEE